MKHVFLDVASKEKKPDETKKRLMTLGNASDGDGSRLVIKKKSGKLLSLGYLKCIGFNTKKSDQVPSKTSQLATEHLVNLKHLLYVCMAVLPALCEGLLLEQN